MFQPVAPVVLVRVLPARREHGVRVGGRAPAPARAHAHRQAAGAPALAGGQQGYALNLSFILFRQNTKKKTTSVL